MNETRRGDHDVASCAWEGLLAAQALAEHDARLAVDRGRQRQSGGGKRANR